MIALEEWVRQKLDSEAIREIAGGDAVPRHFLSENAVLYGYQQLQFQVWPVLVQAADRDGQLDGVFGYLARRDMDCVCSTDRIQEFLMSQAITAVCREIVHQLAGQGVAA